MQSAQYVRSSCCLSLSDLGDTINHPDQMPVFLIKSNALSFSLSSHLFHVYV